MLKNKECVVPFPPQYWDRLSKESKDLVSRMLQKDPAKRLSAVEALEHDWFKNNYEHLQVLNLEFDDIILTDEYVLS